MRSFFVSSLVAGAVLVGCGGDSATTTGASPGSEGGPCYPNDTCDAALSCLSDLCVNANADSGPMGMGGSATGSVGSGASGGVGAASGTGAIGGSGAAGGIAPGGAGGSGVGGVGGAGGSGVGGLGGASSMTCGDGVVVAPEQCDDGNHVDGDACPDGQLGTCQPASCGDGILHIGVEQCDDGGNAPNDGCDASCTLEGGTCPDGNVDPGETCDSAALAFSDQDPGSCATTCRTNCQCPTCGDGVTDFPAGEQCDDGNTTPGDGCDGACLVEQAPSCGDGTLDIAAGEECDDGGNAPNDGCDRACQLEPVGGTSCGDTNPNTGEKCDPPDTLPTSDNGNGCNQTCNLNGVVTTLDPNVDALALASDQQYLWVGTCNNSCGAIGRIDIDACITSGTCTPTTVAGGACPTGGPVDGNGANAELSCVGTLATDGTTVWFGNTRTLRAFDIASADVTTLAGRTGSCAAVDGTGTNGYFHDIRGLTYFKGSVYMLDGCEETLRRFDPSTNSVITIAGTRHADPAVTQQPPYSCPTGGGFTCVNGTPTSGQGLAADFGSPRYMTADNAGNLYITDTNGQAVWRYNTVTGWAEVLISGGAGGLTNAYADGTRAVTTLGRPRGLVSDGTSLYFAEQNYATVRQLELASLATSTFVGTEGCKAVNGQAPVDGVGADSTRSWVEPQYAANNNFATPCVAGFPSGTPVFGTLLGAITYHFPTRSIYVVDDGNRLRRIE